MTDATTSQTRRLLPWIMVGAGVGMIALATIGLRVLFAALAWVGITMAAHQAMIGAIIMALVAIGILVSVLGAILLLARTGSGKAAWLIGSGLVLLVLGSGPLAFVMLTATDRNPNPIFEGMLAGVTFLPAVVLLICGLVVLANHLLRRRVPR
jgi:hypothetical protein